MPRRFAGCDTTSCCTQTHAEDSNDKQRNGDRQHGGKEIEFQTEAGDSEEGDIDDRSDPVEQVVEMLAMAREVDDQQSCDQGDEEGLDVHLETQRVDAPDLHEIG